METIQRVKSEILVNSTVNQVRLNLPAVAGTLGAVAFLLVLASTAGQLTKYLLGHDHGLVSLFNVNTEGNIPTCFSALLLFCASVLLAVITILKNKHKDSDVAKWAILAFGFLFMTFDEVCALHERLSGPVGSLIGTQTFDFFHFAWVIPGLALVFILGLSFLGFLQRLPTRARFTFMGAATLYLGGALGVEMVGGYYAKLHGRGNLTYSMIATVEESLEMAGVIVFIYALLKYLADNYEEVRFRLDTGEKPRSFGLQAASLPRTADRTSH